MPNTPLLTSLITVLAMLFLNWGDPVLAALPAGSAVTDGAAILRNALPIQQKDLRQMQYTLEATSKVVGSSKGNRWVVLNEAASSSQFLVITRKKSILEAIPEARRAEGDALLESLEESVQALGEEASKQNIDGFIALRRKSLKQIGDLEALLVNDFPYNIPEEYNSLPRLLGRATVSIKTTKGSMSAVIDGYNAPLTAGAFVDLALKGFYDGLPFTRAEDNYVLQSGDPKGPESGYIDPTTSQERQVPLEIRVPEEPTPFYNQTFEDLGLYKATPVLPFAALGTLGWAHSHQAIDDGSSQFFLFLYEAELTPAGLNLIDGRNAAFGYVVENTELLKELGVDDRILSIEVVDGADLLKPHA
ncbi:MAG: peptidylprolyl isomerase [Prochlorococcaceae cyanobacterium ETNP1_MAG_8]|nr:peptidylprolyl isomerase [Prochlorococcaceae cyanobacterium ETNP1_MAG_8]